MLYTIKYLWYRIDIAVSLRIVARPCGSMAIYKRNVDSYRLPGFSLV